MKRFTALLVLFMGLLSPLPAQKFKADSCEAELKKDPGNRPARKEYVSALRKINADSAFNICVAEADAAEKAGDIRSAGDWNYYAALCLDQQKKNDDAVKYFQKGVDQLESVKDTFCLDDCQNLYGYLLLRDRKSVV